MRIRNLDTFIMLNEGMGISNSIVYRIISLNGLSPERFICTSQRHSPTHIDPHPHSTPLALYLH